MLLPEVVAMLSAAQSLVAPPAGLNPRDSPGQLTGDALKAAALGAGGVLRTEPISPVMSKCLAKAFRCAGSHPYCLSLDSLSRARVDIF